MVQGQEQEGLNELGLDSGGADGEDGLPGENGRALGDRPDIAREAEIPQVVQKFLAEYALSPQIGDVILVKAQVFNIVDDLLQTGGDGKAAPVGYIAKRCRNSRSDRPCRSENSRCPW